MTIVGSLVRDLRARLRFSPRPASTVVPILIFPPIVSRMVPRGASAELVRLAALIPDVAGKRDFVRQIDAFQRQYLAELTAAYGNAAFAKLMLLKIGNLLIARHGFHHRHTLLAGRPTQIMLDPANSCQLQCPGCVHSPTANGRVPDPSGERTTFDWPKGVMAPALFDRIMSDQGPFAFASILYNYGEPLLHRQFPAMVRRAKSLGMYTWTSSNLSFTFDVDAVIGSGLDLLTMSIDGTSQETLQRYRRRAKYGLCLANMRALAEAKRRASQAGHHGPHLVWQFLTFAHNSHEIETAIELAQEIGVDELHVCTPFDISWDDPTIVIHQSDLARRYVFNEDHRLTRPIATADMAVDATSLDRLLAESHVDRSGPSWHSRGAVTRGPDRVRLALSKRDIRCRGPGHAVLCGPDHDVSPAFCHRRRRQRRHHQQRCISPGAAVDRGSSSLRRRGQRGHGSGPVLRRLQIPAQRELSGAPTYRHAAALPGSRTRLQ